MVKKVFLLRNFSPINIIAFKGLIAHTRILDILFLFNDVIFVFNFKELN